MEKHAQPDAPAGDTAHELLCRLAAATVSCPRHWCRLHRCRRDGVCRGALRPVDAQSPALLLPPCIGDIDAPPMASFRAAFGFWARELARPGATALDSAMKRAGRETGVPAEGPDRAAATGRFGGADGRKP